MSKCFKIVIIDDDPDGIEIIMKAVQQNINLHYGYQINYKILSDQKEIDEMNSIPADIMMFDCALNGQAINFGSADESKYGYELISQYRNKNKRTKIIFYSGSFDFENEMHVGLSTKELIYMINELNVFRITNKNLENLEKCICDAIGNIDSVLISMEELLTDYGENGEFFIDGERISASELLNQLKLGTPLAEKFSNQVNETILTYFMKFGGVKE